MPFAVGGSRTVERKTSLGGKEIYFVVTKSVIERVVATEQIVHTLKLAGELVYSGEPSEIINVVDFDQKLSLQFRVDYADDETTLVVRYGKENTHLVPRNEEKTIVIQKGEVELQTAPMYRRRHAPYTLYRQAM